MPDIKFQYTEFQALTPHEILSLYDEQAPHYNANLMFLERYLGLSALRRQLFGQAKGDVLEVATGTAENLQYLRQDQVTHVTATDFSPAMLNIARQQTARRGLKAEFHEMDAQDLKFPDAMFDTVISSLATCTFPDPLKALREMARVCKPDGRILLLEHGRSRMGLIGWLQDRGAHGMYTTHACRWNQDSQALIKASGLRIIKAQTRLIGILHAIEAAPV